MMRDRVFYGCRPKCMLTQPTAHSMEVEMHLANAKKDSAVFIYQVAICTSSSIGRMTPCQGVGCGIIPHLVLHFYIT